MEEYLEKRIDAVTKRLVDRSEIDCGFFGDLKDYLGCSDLARRIYGDMLTKTIEQTKIRAETYGLGSDEVSDYLKHRENTHWRFRFEVSEIGIEVCTEKNMRLESEIFGLKVDHDVACFGVDPQSRRSLQGYKDRSKRPLFNFAFLQP